MLLAHDQIAGNIKNGLKVLTFSFMSDLNISLIFIVVGRACDQLLQKSLHIASEMNFFAS